LLVKAAALYTAIPPDTHNKILLSNIIGSPTSIPQVSILLLC
jgi:hypothetical protein